MSKLWKFFIFILLALSTPVAAQEEPYQALDQFIIRQKELHKVPGVAVIIVKDGQVVFSKGYGTIRFDGHQKVNENTIFQLASTSKTFSAAGLGVQVDKGNLKWEDEVFQHLPQFALYTPYATRYATSIDLLSHRTGLPAFGGDLLSHIGYSASEILERVRYIQPETSFRNKGLYSNVGFFLAGELLAKIHNSTWQVAIQKTLLDPMQMTRTGFGPILDGSNVAFAHAVINGNMQVIPWDRSEMFPSAGGVMSTTADMAKWMIMHLDQGKWEGKQILKPETVQEIFSPVIAAPITFAELPPIDANSGLSYSLGWNPYHLKGHVIVEKAGALDGMRSLVTLIPEQKIGITVLANLNLSVLPELIRAKFLEEKFGSFTTDLEKKFAEHQTQLEQIIKAPEQPKNTLPMGHQIEQYLGRYTNELYGDFTVVQDQSKLVIEAGPGKFHGELKHWSNDTFTLSWPLVNTGHDLVTFTFGPDGNATEFSSEAYGRFIRP